MYVCAQDDDDMAGWNAMISTFKIVMAASDSFDPPETVIHKKGFLLLNSEHWVYRSWWHLIVFLTYWYDTRTYCISASTALTTDMASY
jgi:hypothetical protein